MSAADHGETDRAIQSLRITFKDLSARVRTLEAKVARVQEPALERGQRGLAELADKINADTPGKVPSNAVAELEARKRLRAVE